MKFMVRLVASLGLILLAQNVSAQEHATLNLATYNLRLNVDSDGVNAWPKRKEMVKGLVRYHEFDIFATQEGLIDQLNDLAQMQEYAFVGAGRDDGIHGGEHSAIFYRKERFTLLQSGNYWLSETPDKPSLGWDATCCKRIASWARFRDRATKREFFFFSVHFDHQGVIARRESGKLMVRKIREIAGSVPVVCAGDFNSTPDTEQIHTMQTLLRDSRQISATPPYGPLGTFNDFKLDGRNNELIDYIFVSAQFKVWKYAVLTDSRDGRNPSDHYPVVVKAELQ
ncbi:MAG TPA: endonuclease/exonuclease/phosphatase family protein [Rudaea sp.]|jgi:endonuclease/exonuclease/phosphatase family metal-dependent hydrolase|uniref:endonuclease/exonuclease/phosphatase family protein n=1 Tax=Rudaea sp. TaxID=2136325 RepID=UPI002F91E825